MVIPVATRLDNRRARSLARIQSARDSSIPRTIGTNPALRGTALPTVTGPGGRRTRARMTGAQKDSLGNRSAWTESQNYRTGVTVDDRWSRTIGAWS